MVSLPTEFTATKYPGYFWNLKDSQLYSLKVSGVLRPLKRTYPTEWNQFKTGYKISVNGQRKFLDILYLKKLVTKNSIIPMGT